jgi:hypothetical protein
MRRSLLALTVAIIAALCVGATAVAQTKPQVKIESKQATLSAGETGAVVTLTVRVKCGPLAPENDRFLALSVTQSDAVVEAFFLPVACTGRWETIPARLDEEIRPGLVPGPATAGAVLQTNVEGVVQDARDTRKIELVQ